MRRLMLDMSPTDLAEGLAITFQQIQKYEKGKRKIGFPQRGRMSTHSVRVACEVDMTPSPRAGTAALASRR